jgi:Protein of unknown function (DUF3617)
MQKSGAVLAGIRSLLSNTSVIAAVGAAALLSDVHAAEPLNIKPGLWEFTQTMTMSGAPLYVEGMTAASRAEYAKSWEKTAGKPDTSHDKDCITAKEIKEAHLFFQDRHNEGQQCKPPVTKQTATAWSVTSECKDAKTTNLIEFNYTAPSPDRLTGVMKSTLTSPNGKTVIDIKMSAKWVGASCPAEDKESDDGDDKDASED